MPFVREHWGNNGRHNKISKTTYREQIRRIKPSRENRAEWQPGGISHRVEYTAEERTGRVKPT